jgi:hypothetical protein
MKTIIAGSRTITREAIVRDAINCCGWNITEVVSGCAKGVDQLGEELARDSDIPVAQFPANWNKYGRSAGPIRNREMAKYAEALIAIWDGKSRGTANMIKVAKGLDLKVFVWKKQAYLHLNSWAGRTDHEIRILKETPLQYKIKLLEDCLKGRMGKVLLVPKHAISFRYKEEKEE